ncbi:hypothetical protein LQF67_01635 [Tetragenococcus halophilus]|uniref:hypothetical protein n=1 Tax=Tetragenococcus halophilus TaxID=51669 RepID=UPI001F40907B|nr:hypothetical protein [Tetragenococcus halophilus]MCF1684279.1 hypothetical protein [Tetragenococcus halophilus]
MGKNNKNSDLKLNKNILCESILKINNNVELSEWYSLDENELEIKVESNIGIKKDDPATAKLLLGVKIFDEEYIEKDKPFYCFVEMEFYFRDDEGEYTEDSPVAAKFSLNMVSIAYPYIRAHISTLSAISGIEQIHIPTINVYNTLTNDED